MILRVPYYYKEFRCIADKCKDSCCIGWEIDIDEDTYDYYNSISGDFGKRLKENMKSGEENCFRLKQGRCPFLNQKNLCDICIELGEEALSEVCTEYPRFTMEYGDVVEKCMALSCEEVGRLLFQSTNPFAYEEMEQEACYNVMWEQDDSDEVFEEEEPEEQYIEAVEAVRESVFHILAMREISIESRLEECLRFCERMQEKVNEGQYEEVIQLTSKDSLLEHKKKEVDRNDKMDSKEVEIRFHQQMKARMNCYGKLEVLDEEWRHTFRHAKETLLDEKITLQDYVNAYKEFMNEDREREYEQLMDYFIFRYFMRAVYDYNLVDKMKFAALSFLCLRDLDLVRFLNQERNYTVKDRIDLSRIYSKEVEHSEENVEALNEMLEFEPELELEPMIQAIKLI